MPDELLRFEIRPSNESTLALEVFKTGVLTGKRHIFFFENCSGEVLYAPASPEKSSARVSIESRSITCKDNWVKPDQKKHILSVALNDMLAANQFSQITFASTSIRKKSSSQYEVTGDLAIRGIVRPVTLQVALKATGSQRLELDGEGEIRMKEYGLKPPSALLGLVGTKDRMQLRFLVWAERAKADANTAGR